MIACCAIVLITHTILGIFYKKLTTFNSVQQTIIYTEHPNNPGVRKTNMQILKWFWGEGRGGTTTPTPSQSYRARAHISDRSSFLPLHASNIELDANEFETRKLEANRCNTNQTKQVQKLNSHSNLRYARNMFASNVETACENNCKCDLRTEDEHNENWTEVRLARTKTKYMSLLREDVFLPSDARTGSEVQEVAIRPYGCKVRSNRFHGTSASKIKRMKVVPTHTKDVEDVEVETERRRDESSSKT